MNNKTYLILHNIRSVQNVGAIFRTADAAGIDKIYLTGYTPTPLDRFGRERSDVAKTALGAQKNIDWEYSKTVTSVINKLKKDKTEIIAVEQSSKAIDYKKVTIKKNTAFVFGNEVNGVQQSVVDLCDVCIEIPQIGTKHSLNISVCAGIVIYKASQSLK